MEKKRIYQLVLVFLLLGTVIGCSKTQVRTNKLVKQGRWVFTELEIGNTIVTQYPKWNLPVAPEDKEFVQGTWTHANGSACKFKWRFDYYEGTFSFLIDPAVTQDESSKAYTQCNNLSGSYAVITEKNKLFEFESDNTLGYPGVTVFIQIQPL